MTGIYEYQPGTPPNEWNSLRLTDTTGRSLSASELHEKRDALMADLLANADVRDALGDDTEIVIYDGDLYIVGGYIRHLMTQDAA
jgi:hypothetical protein